MLWFTIGPVASKDNDRESPDSPDASIHTGDGEETLTRPTPPPEEKPAQVSTTEGKLLWSLHTIHRLADHTPPTSSRTKTQFTAEVAGLFHVAAEPHEEPQVGDEVWTCFLVTAQLSTVSTDKRFGIP
jgi:hypothetical protein